MSGVPDQRARRARPGRRRLAAIGLGLLILLVLLAGAGTTLAILRYGPALDEARALRSNLESIARRAQAAGPSIDGVTVEGLATDLVTERARYQHLAQLLAGDPLVAVARAFPLTAANVRGVDGIAAAAGDLLDAADAAVEIARSFVEITGPQPATGDAGGQPTTLARLTQLMAATHERAQAAAQAVSHARGVLAGLPDGLLGEVSRARDAMLEPLARYGPWLDTYAAASGRLPSILGWDGPRRYLVLTQNPDELRPTGGFIGSFGLITFDKGQITERVFSDIDTVDLPWDYPVIKPPDQLADYLVGIGRPWELADANWSPDFPISAQDAIRLYVNQTGDTRIDGVLGITTDTIDALLEVTGPVAIPEYGVTIAPGEARLKVLQLTRAARVPGENRKAFLSALADHLLGALLTIPPTRWSQVAGQAGSFGPEHLLLAWFKDAADQAFVADAGFGGAVRADKGDYLYAVDANVTPVSKLNAVTTRSLALDVEIDAVGNARNTLDVTWENQIDGTAGKPYREIASLKDLRVLGMYFRLLVPDRSRIESLSGGGTPALTAPAFAGWEAGRAVFGVYLRVPPGSTSLRCAWTSPYAADTSATGGAGQYRLTIQKQPGLLAAPLSVTINVPVGFRITAASAGLTVSGRTATLRTSFTRDVVLGLAYEATTAR